MFWLPCDQAQTTSVGHLKIMPETGHHRRDIVILIGIYMDVRDPDRWFIVYVCNPYMCIYIYIHAHIIH